MSFLDTEPVPIDPLDYAGPWARFRVADARKCLAALRELNRGDLPLTLGLAGGPTLAASLWAVDDSQGCLTFKLDPAAAQVLAVAALPQVWAAAYLGDVKLQFALTELRLSETPGLAGRAAGTTLTLQTRLPRDLYCLPRRRAVRVRRSGPQMPLLRLPNPQAPDTPLCLRAVDVSTTGCALWKPGPALPLAPGTTFKRVEVELDPLTFIVTDLVVQHVTRGRSPQGGPGAREEGLRVGCRWLGMPEPAREALQRWIRGGRRRRELLSLTPG